MGQKRSFYGYRQFFFNVLAAVFFCLLLSDYVKAGTLVFQGISRPDWSGGLVAKTISPVTKEVTGEKWEASRQLDSRNFAIEPRLIFTLHDKGNYGIVFRHENLGEAQKEMIRDSQRNISGSEIARYVKGDQSGENGQDFRKRTSILGAVINSRPVFYKDVVYVGANDGMLHAFDADTGKELFGYIPAVLLEKLPKLADPEFSGVYFVDGTPFVQTITDAYKNSWTALIGGLGKGGKGYFCLDVTRARSLSGSSSDAMSLVKWELTGDNDLGYTTGRPLIVKTRAGWVAVLGNGYDSENGEAVFYVIKNIEKNTPSVKKLHTGAIGSNGIVADITAIDADSNGYADFVYAGDLQGNIWKLDIRNKDLQKWDFAFQSSTGPKPVFTTGNKNGEAQPVTTAVDVVRHCRPDRAGHILVFGTGKNDDRFEPPQTGGQTIYGLWDWQLQWEYIAKQKGAGKDKFFGFFTRPGLSGLNSRPSPECRFPETKKLILLEQRVIETVPEKNGDWVIMSDNPIDYWNPETREGQHAGWFFDLPGQGERVIHNPVIRDGAVIVTSFIPGVAPDGSDSSSVLYTIDACSGGEPFQAMLDTNNDAMVTGDDIVFDSKDKKRRPGGLVMDFPASPQSVLSDFFYIPDPGFDTKHSKIHPISVRGKRPGATYWYIPDYGW